MDVIWVEQSAGDVPTEDDWLSAREQSVLGDMRIPKRRADWRLGRWTAKHAVAAYLEFPADAVSLATIEIRQSASGAPATFFQGTPANLSISISHRAGIGACAVAAPGTMLGCDLELIEPHSDAFIADYFTDDERVMVAQTPAADRTCIAALIWSAKESALKALGMGLRLDTRCVSVVLSGHPREKAGEPRKPRPDPSVSALPNTTADWSPLRVCHADHQTFYGWWRSAGNLLRTVVTTPPTSPPTVLTL